MATFTATRAGASRSAVATGNAQQLQTAWGTIEITTNPLLADKFVMCKVPKGAYIVGGRITGDALDSTGSGSALLSMNVGVDAAVTTATGTTVTAASTSTAMGAAFLFGPDAAAVAGYKQTGTRNYPLGALLYSDGPLLTSDDCNAQLTVAASGLAFSTGTLNLFVDYYMSTTS